jgi:hypothetical protein
MWHRLGFDRARGLLHLHLHERLVLGARGEEPRAAVASLVLDGGRGPRRARAGREVELLLLCVRTLLKVSPLRILRALARGRHQDPPARWCAMEFLLADAERGAAPRSRRAAAAGRRAVRLRAARRRARAATPDRAPRGRAARAGVPARAGCARPGAAPTRAPGADRRARRWPAAAAWWRWSARTAGKSTLAEPVPGWAGSSRKPAYLGLPRHDWRFRAVERAAPLRRALAGGTRWLLAARAPPPPGARARRGALCGGDRRPLAAARAVATSRADGRPAPAGRARAARAHALRADPGADAGCVLRAPFSAARKPGWTRAARARRRR